MTIYCSDGMRGWGGLLNHHRSFVPKRSRRAQGCQGRERPRPHGELTEKGSRPAVGGQGRFPDTCLFLPVRSTQARKPHSDTGQSFLLWGEGETPRVPGSRMWLPFSSPGPGEHSCLAVITTLCVCRPVGSPAHPSSQGLQGRWASLWHQQSRAPRSCPGPIGLTGWPLPGAGRSGVSTDGCGAEATRAACHLSHCGATSQQVEGQCPSASTVQENRKSWDKILHLPMIVATQLFSVQ